MNRKSVYIIAIVIIAVLAAVLLTRSVLLSGSALTEGNAAGTYCISNKAETTIDDQYLSLYGSDHADRYVIFDTGDNVAGKGKTLLDNGTITLLDNDGKTVRGSLVRTYKKYYYIANGCPAVAVKKISDEPQMP